MPDAPKRFCSAPRCPNRVVSGRCERHQRTRHEARRPTDPRYGSQRWRYLSLYRLAEHPFCELCGQLGEVTDHIVPVTEAPERFWDETNHRTLCRRCNRSRPDLRRGADR